VCLQETGLTSLMLAVRESRLVIAERLADFGASVNEKAKVSRHSDCANLYISCCFMVNNQLDRNIRIRC